MRRLAIGAGVLALGASACVLFDSLSGFSDGVDPEDAALDGNEPNDAPVPLDARSVFDAATDSQQAVDAPPTFVQAQATASDDAATVATTFDGSLGAGDTVVVALGYSSSSASLVSVNDTQNDAFETVLSNLAPNGRHYYIVVSVGVKAGPDNVSVQLDGPVPEIELYIQQYANISAFGMAGVMSGTGSDTDGMQSPLLVTTVPNELLFGYGTTGAAKIGTSFTLRSAFHDNLTEDRLLVAPGSYRATATVVAGVDWTMVGATFKPR